MKLGEASETVAGDWANAEAHRQTKQTNMRSGWRMRELGEV
jgi:hypothetical protein